LVGALLERREDSIQEEAVIQTVHECVGLLCEDGLPLENVTAIPIPEASNQDPALTLR
jgi:hypothetical protein